MFRKPQQRKPSPSHLAAWRSAQQPPSHKAKKGTTEAHSPRGDFAGQDHGPLLSGAASASVPNSPKLEKVPTPAKRDRQPMSGAGLSEKIGRKNSQTKQNEVHNG